MKKNLLLSLVLLAAGSLMAADASPKDEVTAAANALASQPNYSWRTTLENASGGFRRGPTDGKTEKNGYTTLVLSLNDNNTIDAVIKGTNGAIKTAEKGWQSAAEAAQDSGGGFNPVMFVARMLAGYKAPAAQVLGLVGDVKTLAAGTNGISGELSEEGAKAELLFRRTANADGPTISNAKGSVTFWLADGKLTKYEVHVSGTMNFNGNDRDIDRTTLTVIKDVGTTKVEVADEAKKKLE